MALSTDHKDSMAGIDISDANNNIQDPGIKQVIYTADAQLRRPRQFIKQMAADLISSRELAWRLLVRDIQATYRRSLLGYAWVLIPPIVSTLIWVYLNKFRIINVGEMDIPYPIYVLVGTLLWQGFVDALGSPLQQLSASQPLLTKLNLPWEAIILSGIGQVLFDFVIRLSLVLVTFAIFQVSVPITILLAPLGILSLLALGGALGLWLAPLGLLYQDVQRGLSIVTTLWFFITPVVYTPPTIWPASLLAFLNPVTPLLATTREMMTTGTVSNAGAFALISCITLALFLTGWVLFRLAIPHIVERLSAR